MAFISYYFHWSEHEVLSMDHMTRRRWCREISTINATIEELHVAADEIGQMAETLYK